MTDGHQHARRSSREIEIDKDLSSHYLQYLYDRDSLSPTFDRYVFYILLTNGIRKTGKVIKRRHIFMLTQPWIASADLEDMAKEAFLAGAGRFSTEFIPVATAKAMKKTTALVLCLGDRHTFICPVINGQLHAPAIQRSAISSFTITQHLKEELEDPTLNIRTAKFIKEHHCSIAKDFKRTCTAVEGKRKRVTTDIGAKLTVPQHALISCGELYFKPKLVRNKRDEDFFQGQPINWELGIHKLIQTAILSCPSQYHLELWRNILLEGDTAFLPGLPERLKHELSLLVPRTLIQITVCPKYSAWKGAALLSTSIQQKTVTREEYQSPATRSRCMKRFILSGSSFHPTRHSSTRLSNSIVTDLATTTASAHSNSSSYNSPILGIGGDSFHSRSGSAASIDYPVKELREEEDAEEEEEKNRLKDKSIILPSSSNSIDIISCADLNINEIIVPVDTIPKVRNGKPHNSYHGDQDDTSEIVSESKIPYRIVRKFERNLNRDFDSSFSDTSSSAGISNSSSSDLPQGSSGMPPPRVVSTSKTASNSTFMASRRARFTRADSSNTASSSNDNMNPSPLRGRRLTLERNESNPELATNSFIEDLSSMQAPSKRDKRPLSEVKFSSSIPSEVSNKSKHHNKSSSRSNHRASPSSTSTVISTAPHLDDPNSDHIKAKPELPPKPSLNLVAPTIRFFGNIEQGIQDYWIFTSEVLTPQIIELMKNREFVESVVVPRYQKFVYLKQTLEPESAKQLVPDIFIEIAWQSHMCYPPEYREYSKRHYNGKILSHSIRPFSLAHQVESSTLEHTAKVWKKAFQGESFTKTMPTPDAVATIVAEAQHAASASASNKSKSTKAKNPSSPRTTSPSSVPSSSNQTVANPHMVLNYLQFSPKKWKSDSKKLSLPPIHFDLAGAIIHDMDWVASFPKSLRKLSGGNFSLKTLNLPRTLEVVYKSYELFFYLLLKYGNRYNTSFFQPPGYIQLVWRAHMMIPQCYLSDCKAFQGHLIAPSFLDSSQSFDKAVKSLQDLIPKSNLPPSPAEFLKTLSVLEFGGTLDHFVKSCPTLPLEVLSIIFKKLPTSTTSISQVNKHWSRAAKLNDVWLSHVSHDFPHSVPPTGKSKINMKSLYFELNQEFLGNAVIFDMGAARIKCGLRHRRLNQEIDSDENEVSDGNPKSRSNSVHSNNSNHNNSNSNSTNSSSISSPGISSANRAPTAGTSASASTSSTYQAFSDDVTGDPLSGTQSKEEAMKEDQDGPEFIWQAAVRRPMNRRRNSRLYNL